MESSGLLNLCNQYQLFNMHSAGSRRSASVDEGRQQSVVSASSGDPICERITIVNPLLAYVANGLNNSTPALVATAALQVYTTEEITEAKKVLFEKNGIHTDIIGVYHNRQNTQLRSSGHAHLEDIIKAVQALDSSGNSPLYSVAIADIEKVPRSKPEELNTVSYVERLNDLENSVRDMKILMDRLVAQNSELKQNEVQMTGNLSDLKVEVEQLKAENHTLKEELSICVRATDSKLTFAEVAAIKSSISSSEAKPKKVQTQCEQLVITPPTPTKMVFRKKSNNDIIRKESTLTAEPQPKLMVKLPNKSIVTDSSVKTSSTATGMAGPVHIADDHSDNHTQATMTDDSTESSVTNAQSGEVPNPSEVPQLADGFQFPRKKRRPKRVITGTKAHDKVFGAPEPSRSVFIYRVHQDTNLDDLKDMLTGEGIEVRALESVSAAQSRFKSFRLDVPKSSLDACFSPALWPNGILVRPFYWPKRRD